MWICNCLQLQNVNRESENPFGGSWVETCGRTTDGEYKRAHTFGRIKESQADRHSLVCKLSYTSRKQRRVLYSALHTMPLEAVNAVEKFSLWRGVWRRGMWLARPLSENEWFSLYNSRFHSRSKQCWYSCDRRWIELCLTRLWREKPPICSKVDRTDAFIL